MVKVCKDCKHFKCTESASYGTCTKMGIYGWRKESRVCGKSYEPEKEKKEVKEPLEFSDTEIRLFNHKTNKALYKVLTNDQLDKILRIVESDQSDWN